MDIGFDFKAHNIARAVKSGDISVIQVLEHFIARTDALNPILGTHSHWDPEMILRCGSLVQENLQKWKKMGKPLRLAGVPIAIKDNISTVGMPTTCGSRLLRKFRPVYSAEAIARLLEEGAVLFGKTNMDEFGMGSSTENSIFGPTRNPWNLNCVAGGSSGGSAAAVAAGMVPLSLGSDTGGSVRQPASFCGVVGLKPSYGRVSRRGLVAYGSSLDQIGPMAKDVKDVCLALDTISGFDSRDPTSKNLAPLNCMKNLDVAGDLSGRKIGLITEFFPHDMNLEIKDAVVKASKKLKEIGAEIIEFSVNELKYLIPTYYLIAMSEASANLARFDGVRFGSQEKASTLEELYLQTRTKGFGGEVKKRIMLGAYALSAGYYDEFYHKASLVRHLLKERFAEIFSKVDVILSPTAPSTAFALGQKDRDSLSQYLGDVYTVSANLIGSPAISLPSGLDQSGLPIGIQFMGKPFSEESLLQIAYQYEKLVGSTLTPKVEVS